LGQIGCLVKEELLVERGFTFARRTTSACKKTWTSSVILVSSAVDAPEKERSVIEEDDS
jgi:hypothetical protein